MQYIPKEEMMNLKYGDVIYVQRYRKNKEPIREPEPHMVAMKGQECLWTVRVTRFGYGNARQVEMPFKTYGERWTAAWPDTIKRQISATDRKRAERCLVDNGIAKDEAPIVLQAIGYILLGQELYPEQES